MFWVLGLYLPKKYTMKRVLLPTDFSDNAWNAIEYALQLYKSEACHFTLLNTYNPLIHQVKHLQSSATQLMILRTIKTTSKRRLNDLFQKIENHFSNPKHAFAQISAFNTLTSEIDKLFEGNAMDIIIMGTKGATGLKKVLFGSNIVNVIKNAKCPVIAIPGDFSFENPHEILFPTDYDIDYQKKHLQCILDISDLYGARINVLHAYYKDNLTLRQEKNRKKLKNYLDKAAHLFHDVKSKDISDTITKFQSKAHINFLAMINNEHSIFENLFFKSKINEIGFHLKLPFLVIPSKT